MTEPTTAYVVVTGALAITVGLLVRAFRTCRVPTIRSVIQAERRHFVRICKQAVHGTAVLSPDVLERIEVAGASEGTDKLGKTEQSQLRTAARERIRAQLIRLLSGPSGQSTDGGARLPADLLGRPQLDSGSPLGQDGKSVEREASRQLLEVAITRYISTSNATQTLAAVLDMVRDHTLDYSQLIVIEDEAELTLDSDWTPRTPVSATDRPGSREGE